MMLSSAMRRLRTAAKWRQEQASGVPKHEYIFLNGFSGKGYWVTLISTDSAGTEIEMEVEECSSVKLYLQVLHDDTGFSILLGTVYVGHNSAHTTSVFVAWVT
uniref:Uncharacterized protein n=1 Tax=Chenopodium quinoa TaxID=63459 RepID=A0A803N8P6_CHEQI